jgi:hypothetical protein
MTSVEKIKLSMRLPTDAGLMHALAVFLTPSGTFVPPKAEYERIAAKNAAYNARVDALTERDLIDRGYLNPDGSIVRFVDGVAE